jgi:CIC family chloride channel protein
MPRLKQSPWRNATTWFQRVRPRAAGNFASLEFFRSQLASVEALPQLAVLAVITGALAGAVILSFRAGIEFTLTELLPERDPENFEGLRIELAIGLPLLGGLLLGLIMQPLRPSARRVGVVHVMERLSLHQGYLPLRNALLQFFGGMLALVTGQSGGREGPAVHLGAAASSQLGQIFRLPNNSIRTLVGCGTAAAIAASFNTPIAGVIFAMEVVMMEYTIGSFIPVILASVTATLLTRYVYGADPAFVVPALSMQSLAEIPFIIFAGILLGGLAAMFNMLVQRFSRLSHRAMWQRGLLAGALTGGAALLTPQVLGIGYDTVNGAMIGQIAVTTLALLVVTKLIASAACVGLGLPVGLIGPSLVIGAAFGGVLGSIGSIWYPEAAASPGFYVMLGMTAMMAAVLQAPLAALMTVLELTANPNIILPAMLVIVFATMTASQVFRQRSVFLSTLDTLGLQYPPNPVSLHLQRAGVASLMQRDFVRVPAVMGSEETRLALQRQLTWVVVESADGEPHCVLNANDLNIFMDEHHKDSDDPVDFMNVPGMRKDVAVIDIQATLQQALDHLRDTGVEALCVTRTSAPLITPIVGIVTREDIDRYAGVSS